MPWRDDMAFPGNHHHLIIFHDISTSALRPTLALTCTHQVEEWCRDYERHGSKDLPGCQERSKAGGIQGAGEAEGLQATPLGHVIHTY